MTTPRPRIRRNTAKALGLNDGTPFTFYGFGTRPTKTGTPGRITAVRDGFYTVTFDDGTTEQFHVARKFCAAR